MTTLSERAGSLTNALRTPHVRGRWGEAQLRNVVEYAGMVEHCDYVAQATTSTEDGTLRPDLVVRIPGGKHVVVDAKAPLAAYLDAFETSDDAERERHLADHARQVREHVTKLSAKGYWRQFEPSPDFVVMFLPDESYLRVGARARPGAPGVRLELERHPRLAEHADDPAPHRRHDLAAGDDRGERARGQRRSGASSTSGSRRWARTSRGSAGRSTARSRRYNETVGSLERQVLPQARRFEQHGITGVEPPELQPIERQTRPLAAAELVDADSSADEPRARGRRRRRVAGTWEHETVAERSLVRAPRRAGLTLSREELR